MADEPQRSNSDSYRQGVEYLPTDHDFRSASEKKLWPQMYSCETGTIYQHECWELSASRRSTSSLICCCCAARFCAIPFSNSRMSSRDLGDNVGDRFCFAGDFGVRSAPSSERSEPLPPRKDELRSDEVSWFAAEPEAAGKAPTFGESPLLPASATGGERLRAASTPAKMLPPAVELRSSSNFTVVVLVKLPSKPVGGNIGSEGSDETVRCKKQ